MAPFLELLIAPTLHRVTRMGLPQSIGKILKIGLIKHYTFQILFLSQKRISTASTYSKSCEFYIQVLSSTLVVGTKQYSLKFNSHEL